MQRLEILKKISVNSYNVIKMEMPLKKYIKRKKRKEKESIRSCWCQTNLLMFSNAISGSVSKARIW